MKVYGTAIIDRLLAVGGDLANFRSPSIGLIRALMVFAGFFVGSSILEFAPITTLIVVLISTSILTSDLVGGGMMVWASTICGIAWAAVNFIIMQALYITAYGYLARFTPWVIGGAMLCMIIWGYYSSKRVRSK